MARRLSFLSNPVGSRARHRMRARSGALAAGGLLLSLAAFVNPVHATYPGENGAIVFELIEQNVLGIARATWGNPQFKYLGDGYSPRVAPNGRQIAFLRGAYQQPGDVYVMDIDGSNVVQLTTDKANVAVSWKPDGTQLAYVRAPYRGAPADLWTMNPDGSGKSRVREISSTGIAYTTLEWSLGPTTFAYENSGGGLYVADTFTPGSRRLDPSDYSGWAPSWVPDGKTIIYGRISADGSAVDMAAIQSDGSNIRLIPPLGTGGTRKAVSPDGKSIVGWDAMGVMAIRDLGGNLLYSWNRYVVQSDWGRMPKNCYQSNSTGAGKVLADDVNFYATQCVMVFTDPGVLQRTGIHAHALAIGPDQRLYHRMLKADSSGGLLTWTPFTVVPGVGGSAGGILVRKVALVSALDGSLQVVAINSLDNRLYQTMRKPAGDWGQFMKLDGFAGAPTFQARDVAISLIAQTPNDYGNLQVIASDVNQGSVYYGVQFPNRSWQPFDVIPGAQGMNAHALAIAAGPSDLSTGALGGTNILAVTTQPDGSQGAIRRILRDVNSNWGAWMTVSLPPSTQISKESDVAIGWSTVPGAPVRMMYTDSSGRAIFQKRESPQYAASWQSQASSTTFIADQARAVSLSPGIGNGDDLSSLVTRDFPQ